MKDKISNCFICYEELITRSVEPCHFCGAWNDKPDTSVENRKHYKFKIDNGKNVIFCHSCFIEEFLVGDSGGQPYSPKISPEFLGFEPNTKLEDIFHFDSELENPTIETDKVCPNCKLRLTYMKTIQELKHIKPTSA